jgi:hypothetical protein
MGPATPTPVYPVTWVNEFWLKQFHQRVAAELGDDPATATGDFAATMRRCVKLAGNRPVRQARYYFSY